MINEEAAPNDDQPELKSLRADRPREDVVFEEILEEIGSRGRFQRRFNIVITYGSSALVAMTVVTFILAIVVPDHWCHVPGMENTNFSIEQWKNFTLPRERGSYSRCEMFKEPGDPTQVVPCEHGWEFDDTWFSLTIPMQQGWVCQDEIKLANSVFLSRSLAVVVGLLLPYIGDRYGRKLQYLLSITAVAVGRTATVFTPSVYYLFVLTILIGDCGLGSTIESSLAVSLELTDIANRSSITFYWYCYYSIAFVVGAMIAWAARNFMCFMLVASVPCFLPLLCYRIFPESPRWLFGKGRPEAAVSVVRKIAETNRVQLPSDVSVRIAQLSQKRSRNLGITSLVTNRNLFKNTLLLIFGRSVAVMVYWVMEYNIGYLGTNPFILIAIGNLAHLPGFLLAHRLGDYIGRRAANCCAMIAMSVINIAIIGVLSGENSKLLELSGVVILKMFDAVSLAVCNLQSLEIHPTCIRQSAAALEMACSGMLMATAPYIVLLGKTTDYRYMYGVMAALTSLGAVLLSFLPESMHEKLPETLKDASTYGKNQQYWSLPPPRSTPAA